MMYWKGTLLKKAHRKLAKDASTSMTKKQLIIVIGTIVLMAQIMLFRNYLPFLTNKIITKGQRCTCPHAQVLSGEANLKKITPDSLIKYNLDYSEVYFENEISTASDPMGVHQYIITGQIIGKGSISEGDGQSYPLIRIDDYHDATLYKLFSWTLLGLLFIELFVLYRLAKKRR